MSCFSKRGLILNIGSFAGDVPVPMMATYSARWVYVLLYVIP